MATRSESIAPVAELAPEPLGHVHASGDDASALSAEEIRAQVDRVLASTHFRNSRRHTQLLNYLVDKASSRRPSEIKERLIGVEVFGRPVEYDLASDAVVRGAVVELRKRLAQYYADPQHAEQLRIDLPVGSYVLHFHLPESAAAGPLDSARQGVPQDKHLPPIVQRQDQTHAPPSYRKHVLIFAMVPAAAILLLLVIASFAMHTTIPANRRALDEFWAPILGKSDSIIVCTGTLNEAMQEPVVKNDTWLHMTKTQNHLDSNAGAALLRIGSVLGVSGKKAIFRLSDRTELSDLRQQPIIFIGGLNNQWSQRVLYDSRFRLEASPDGSHGVVTDALQHTQTPWSIDFESPVTAISRDYAIVTRKDDPITGQPTLLLSGLGSYGNAAASEFVSNPVYFSQFLRTAPKDWATRNIQIVLETIVVNGYVGAPKVIAEQVNP